MALQPVPAQVAAIVEADCIRFAREPTHSTVKTAVKILQQLFDLTINRRLRNDLIRDVVSLLHPGKIAR